MAIIEADGLTKTYRVFQKKEGLLGALRGLYRREFKEVKAVDGVSFSIEPGEMVAFLGPERGGEDDDPEDALGPDLPDVGARRRCWALPPGSGPTRSAASSRW